MTLTAFLVVLGLAGALFFITAVRNVRHRRVGALLGGLAAVVLFAIAAAAALLSLELRTYQRLTHEQPAGEIQFARLGHHEFNGAITFPSGERSNFALRGDEWQVDARILKWRALASVVGFDTGYRLERISGRYANVEDERNQPRTVYPLHQTQPIDPWQLLHGHASWMPWVDALYGSAAYLPMADGALYQISVSHSGLVARPLNQAARTAVGGWPQPAL